MISRTVFFSGLAIVIFCAVLLLWPSIDVSNQDSAKTVGPYFEQLSASWSGLTGKYFSFSLPGFDIAAPAAACVFGVMIVFGIDRIVKRRSDDAIKRLFTHISDD